jgi:hypothetical protein
MRNHICNLEDWHDEELLHNVEKELEIHMPNGCTFRRDSNSFFPYFARQSSYIELYYQVIIIMVILILKWQHRRYSSELSY